VLGLWILKKCQHPEDEQTQSQDRVENPCTGASKDGDNQPGAMVVVVPIPIEVARGEAEESRQDQEDGQDGFVHCSRLYYRNALIRLTTVIRLPSVP
jgi:hypothetical protein